MPTESRESLAANNKHGQQTLALFQGAVIHGGQISISVNSLNQSPTIQTTGRKEDNQEEKRKYKRIKVLSDSEDSLD